VLTVAPGVTGLGGQSSPGASTSTNFAPENWVDASANGRGATGTSISSTHGYHQLYSPRRPEPDAECGFVARGQRSKPTHTPSDYGRNSSIQTVMTSQRRTNEFHGIASDYYQTQLLQARGEFGIPAGTPLPSYHVSNFSFALGVGLSSPIISFSFFVGYEPYYSIGSGGSSIQTYEDPAFVKFAQTGATKYGETQMMAKYPASNATTIGVNATAGQLWSNTLPSGKSASCLARYRKSWRAY